MFNDHEATCNKLFKSLTDAYYAGLNENDLRFYDLAEETVKYIAKELEYLQSQIDNLMLEYCPHEITQEQLDNWAKNQRRVNDN